MVRLLLLVLTVAGIALVFVAKSPGLLGVGLVFGIVGFFGLVLSLAAARVSASARPEASMASVEDIIALRKPRPGSAPPADASRPIGAQAERGS